MTLAFKSHLTRWSRFAIVFDNFLVDDDMLNFDGFSGGLVLVRFFSATALVVTLFGAPLPTSEQTRAPIMPQYNLQKEWI